LKRIAPSLLLQSTQVAPRAGAWIETGYIHSKGGEIEGRPPCGGVD